MEETVFGYCGSKCKHEIYTKEEIDSAIAVLTTTTSGNVKLNYPEGFTQNNCVVTSVTIDNNVFVGSADFLVQVTLRANDISIYNFSGSSFNIKVVLMKTTIVG